MAQAPPGDRFPAYPVSWYVFCASRDLRRSPVARDLLGRRLVAFRTDGGRVAVLDARCSHLGSDLGKGRVAGGVLRCPFHHWEYGPDGRCVRVPCQDEPPATARQAAYPAIERHGLVFFFNGPRPSFSLPFFPDCRPKDFAPAEPFETVLSCPWYMVGANHFDLQHFRAAHDRRLVGTPAVGCPAPFARSASATFRVEGTSFQDRLTRRFAGPEVRMAVTDWCGTMMFATATFPRARTYGLTLVEPLDAGRTLVRVVVFIRRAAGLLGRLLLDPLRLRVRRAFIRRFLSADWDLLNGIRYNPAGLIDCDRELAGYLRWLSIVSRGVPFGGEGPETGPVSLAAGGGGTPVEAALAPSTLSEKGTRP